ncbi:MAG: ABC transporter substrate-binding protein [Chloroflexota bacterium]
MTKFIVRRILISIPTLLGISLVLFTIISLAPGDPFGDIALNPNVPPEVQQKLRQQLGLDQPVYVRYVKWLTALLKGDWGVSFVNRAQVVDLIWQRLPTTILVLGTAYVLALLIALPVGIVSAVNQYSLWDHLATTFAFLGYSLPTFFTGLLFILVFTVKLRWLPEVYTTNIQAGGVQYAVELLRHAAMPILVLALFQSAELTRYVRSSVLDVIHLDYVRTARAKGLSEPRVVLVHAVRNALIPVVTIMALQIPAIFTGALITEQIFRVPGIGSLLIASINAHDTPVIMGIVFTYAVLVVTFNLIADVLYGVLDPRIKYE